MPENLAYPQPDWLDVSRETLDALVEFAQLVVQWTARINLISPTTVPDIWNRHILDSAQLFLHAKDGQTWVDLGSGGGFPGIIMAILARESHPDWRLNLVESDHRKTAFLRKAAQVLHIEVNLHPVRSEVLPPLAAQTVTARALAPLPDLLTHVSRHMTPTGRAILAKGARANDEVQQARAVWNFDLRSIPSHTDPNAQILIIENLRHV